jgi:tRNA(adenine34) deaminase
MNNNYFMEKALNCAKEAYEAGEFPVGSVLVYDETVIAAGARTGTTGRLANETDHAEMIVLRKLELLGHDLDRSRMALFSTLEPCLMCFGAILLSRIGQVVYAYEDVMGGGTGCDLTKLTPLYADQKISIVPHILREKSLVLFKDYFQDPKNFYWQGSLLARYTLSQ